MIDSKENGYIYELWIDANDKNSLNVEFFKELSVKISSIKDNPRYKCVIIGSKNEKYFSNGFEPSMFLDKSFDDIKEILVATMEALVKVLFCPLPVVCVINGHCMGVGSVLATFCDYRIMALGKARIGFPEALIGINYPSGTGFVLKEIVGLNNARDLLYNARPIKANEAKEIRLVDEIGEVSEVYNLSQKYCAKFQDMAMGSVLGIKKSLRDFLKVQMDHFLKTDNDVLAKAIHSYNGQEGMRSIVEGRRPVFK
jgi:enoyl-CoA hydratase